MRDRVLGLSVRLSATLKAQKEIENLLPELVPRGTVQEEVDGMVCVHEKLRHCHDQLQSGHSVDGGAQLVRWKLVERNKTGYQLYKI